MKSETRGSRFPHLKLLTIGAMALVVYLIAGGSHLSHLRRASALDTATSWARVAPLPGSARNVHVDVKRSPFTREFVVTFEDSPLVIQQWLAASTGPSSASQTTTGSMMSYAIAPGGGAMFAEVTIDFSANRVTISTSWS